MSYCQLIIIKKKWIKIEIYSNWQKKRECNLNIRHEKYNSKIRIFMSCTFRKKCFADGSEGSDESVVVLQVSRGWYLQNC
jgi:hypothetical protein